MRKISCLEVIGMIQDVQFEHEYDPDWGDHTLVAILPGAQASNTEGQPLEGVGGEKRLPGGDVVGVIKWNEDTQGIQHIEVAPEYQRQGVATQLFNEANKISPVRSDNGEYSHEGWAWANSMNRQASVHKSDCAVHNGPALPVGSCTCRKRGF